MLPSPTIQRFQPLRSGLINLFKYQDQEFWFERGRLLIRGNNGTGKSRVLALQLPFLLDGEISPRRVEPDGDPARQIAWHLLMDEYENRTGYTWIEFGRLDEDGSEHFLTLGCGMRAIRGGDNQPTRWFFITEQRVGKDFSLLSGQQPLTADRLAEVISSGCLYKSASDYRDAIDKRLFGIGQERYKALIELLIRLRSTQLGKKLDERTLFAALSDSLPPLPAEVVESVASAFKDLDDLREQYEHVHRLSLALSEFRSGYQGYLQTALLRRAEALRSRHSEFEHAQRRAAATERELEQAGTDEAEANEAFKQAGRNYVSADAKYDAVRSSQQSQDAQSLDAAKHAADSERKRSEKADEQALSAARLLDETSADLENAEADRETRSSLLTKDCQAATELSGPAGFRADHLAHLPAPGEWSLEEGSLAKQIEQHELAVGNHLHRLEQIGAGLTALAVAKDRLATAQSKEDGFSSETARHRETAQGRDSEAREAVAQLARNFAEWQSNLRWLVIAPWSDLATSLEDWLETTDPAHRLLAGIVASSGTSEKVSQAKARNELESRQAVLRDARQKLTDEQALLVAGPPPPPVAPVTRDSDSRAGRPGAPFWQACEFQPHLDFTQRAGLEAALEAAGLLDAWISPDGTLSGEMPFDTFLATEQADEHGSSLTDWLHPDPALVGSLALSAETIRQVLTRIGASPSEQGHWVALDGQWRLGPAFGRGRKPEAVYLGSASRELARKRRLTAIDAALTEISSGEAELTGDFDDLADRVREAEAEIESAPDDETIGRLLVLREDSIRSANAAELAHADAVKETHRAREAATEAERTLHRDARDLGYGEHLHRLDQLQPSWPPYLQAMTRLWGNAQAWVTAAVHAGNLDRRRQFQADEAQRLEDDAEATRTEALRASEYHQTLVERLGSSIEAYQRELEAARDNRDAAQKARDGANQRILEAGQRRTALTATLSSDREKLSECDERRGHAIRELRVPLFHGLFPEAEPGLADIETGEWAPTRAYAIARRIAKELPDFDLSDPAWTERLNQLESRIHDLRTLTGPLGCQVASRTLAEGLSSVTCHYQGNTFTPAACLSSVEIERETHQRLLGDREREIIDRHLVAEVSMHLQSLIDNARQRTEEMNAEMSGCATTLGVALRLIWEPVNEGLPPALPHVRKLILSDHAAWTDEERSKVGNFLHQLIKEERGRDPAASGTEQLLRALDYRKWHAFVAERRQNDRWERLTRKRYGTGSGGEKALMLTIPQMAAAASHYRSTVPHAPRLILLDEAFAGMDKPTRAKCMGLLEAFNLDLLMTSEREWGAHATVSGIAIYQLVADADAVAATRWVWNGHQKTYSPVPDTPELRQPPPLSASESEPP